MPDDTVLTESEKDTLCHAIVYLRKRLEPDHPLDARLIASLDSAYRKLNTPDN